MVFENVREPWLENLCCTAESVHNVTVNF